MKKQRKKPVRILAAAVAAFSVFLSVSAPAGMLSASAAAATHVVTDMAGRKNTLPLDLTRISVIHPIPCQMVWRLAPKKLASVDKQFLDRIEFMSSAEQARIKALPVTGEFHSGLSAEQVLAANPQAVISLTKDTDIDTEQKEFNLPVVAASKDTLSDIANSWRFIGKLVGNEKSGDALGSYWDNTVKMVTRRTSHISTSDKLKVYYATKTVTSTVGVNTIMASVIKLAGGISYMDQHTSAPADETNESIPVSMEDIVKWNPDVIITLTESGKEQIESDPAWKDLAAVKNHLVYASRKYEMLDRTQSLMGLLWTAKELYPKKVSYNLKDEVKKFYAKVYLDTNVPDSMVTQLNN
jgi:ABC-type Fe3+-hydroxamate transport system, periplasmic component